MALTARVEDYLEAVLEIEMTGEFATVTEIAKKLGVTKATVTTALKRLKLADLLEHEHYGDVMLTEKGRETALAIYRRHEFLSDFFVRILGFSRERAQKVSCAMEHEIDAKSERRLAAFTDSLAQAERNNEGWLRDLQAKLDSARSLPIPLCMAGDAPSAVIARLTAQYELRKRLQEMGLIPGKRVYAIETNSMSSKNRCSFTIDNKRVSLSVSEASAVWLDLDDDPPIRE